MEKTIGVCGYGYSGSGAVVDLLRECSEVNYINYGEFNISYIPDGLEDLRFHIMDSHSRYLSSDIALKRYHERISKYVKSDVRFPSEIKKAIIDLTTEYINSLTMVSWIGYWGVDYQETIGKLSNIRYRVNNKFYSFFKRFKKQGLLYPERVMRLSINPPQFEEITRDYVHSVLLVLGYKEGKINIIDQLFAADDPVKSFSFFKNPMAILVDRDPRDVYILAKNTLVNHSLWIPTSNVKSFVEYYKCIREHEKNDSNNILRLYFEELVYDYDKTKQIIADFIGIHAPSLNGGLFNPEISINNTQLYEIADKKFVSDINYIERNLSSYLFDFSRYSIRPSRNSKVF